MVGVGVVRQPPARTLVLIFIVISFVLFELAARNTRTTVRGDGAAERVERAVCSSDYRADIAIASVVQSIRMSSSCSMASTTYVKAARPSV